MKLEGFLKTLFIALHKNTADKEEVVLETSPYFPLYSQTAVTRAWHEQRVCFPPARILMTFKVVRLKGEKKSSLRDRIKGGGGG